MKLSDITFKQSKKFEFKDPITNKSYNPKVYIEILSSESKEAKNNLLKAQRKIFELTQDKDNLEDGKLKQDIIDDVNKVYFSSLILGWKNIDDFPEVTDEAKLKLIENEIIYKFLLESASYLGNFKD